MRCDEISDVFTLFEKAYHCMPQSKAFEKRVRRRITGRTQLFFAVTAPGLEDLCYQEILSLSVTPDDITREKGGILFRGKVHECYKANLLLRTANRILMRIVEFKATNFRQLKKKLLAIEWELYLQNHMISQIQVTARHSRLFHSDAVELHLRDAIKSRFENSGSGAYESVDQMIQQILYVRISDDIVTVSIDSSGEVLHKRGLKTHGARAPIRETIAAAALKLAGYRGTAILVDPMCGSGTFAFEGAMLINKIPAGWFRTFAFEEWPCFRPEMWNYIRREESKKMASPNQVMVFSSDTDEMACRRLQDAVSECGLQHTISVSNRDFFDIAATDFSSLADYEDKGLVVINPPYGMRIGTPENSRKLLSGILKKLSRDFSGWKFVLIVPQEMIGKIQQLPIKAHRVFHGGIHLVIAVGRVQDQGLLD